MSAIPQDLKYTEDHEWAKLEGSNTIRVGITDFAKESLGDVVFVELPKLGRLLKAKETFGVVESIKAVSDLYSPLDGEVVEVNAALQDNPGLINASPYGDGWIMKLKIKEPQDYQALLTPEKYAQITR